jgi:protein-S-isoprenylcysteine O-methyltransferase
VDSNARDLSAGEDDRGSTAVIGATFGSAILTPPLASWLVRARLPSTFRWAGVLAMAGGIGLRIWSAKILGAGYTRTLRVRAEQRVIDAGPYRVIRHPGYAGDIVMWAGWGLAWGTWAGWALASAPSVAAYIYRIGVEEDLLARKLGPAYRSYQARTWRLVPGIW